jgi:outer membrane protein TolC
MMKSLKYILIFAILTTNFAASNAQIKNDSKDSLYYYLEQAVKNNPTVLQRFSEYQAALQKIPQVGSLPDPELSIGVFLKPMELVMGNQTADIRLMQMFPWFGTLKAAKDEMSLMANAKYESFREAKLQVFYDIQSTWYELYKINQEIRISDKNLQILKTIERLALVRFRTSGMQSMSGGQVTTPPSVSGSSYPIQENDMGNYSGGSGLTDLYRIQIEIGELENNIALLNNQQSTITAKFNSYLNRPMQSDVAVTDSLRADTLNISLAAVSDSILKNNPMLGMLQYEQLSLDARKKMVTRMGYPMLGLGVDYSMINKSEMSTSPMNGKDMIMPMVSVTLPIYRKKYKAMRNEADLLKTSVVQNYTSTANDLQTEYYQAVQLYQDANRRMKLYLNQYQLANKSLDIMLKSFSASGSSLTDILRIQQQTLDYELKQVEAVAEYNTSIAWLERLVAISQY